LEDAKKLDLHSKRKVTNFIQKDGSALSILEASDLPLVCAGESPALMTKQLAFKERFRD